MSGRSSWWAGPSSVRRLVLLVLVAVVLRWSGPRTALLESAAPSLNKLEEGSLVSEISVVAVCSQAPPAGRGGEGRRGFRGAAVWWIGGLAGQPSCRAGVALAAAVLLRLETTMARSALATLVIVAVQHGAFASQFAGLFFPASYGRGVSDVQENGAVVHSSFVPFGDLKLCVACNEFFGPPSVMHLVGNLLVVVPLDSHDSYAAGAGSSSGLHRNMLSCSILVRLFSSGCDDYASLLFGTCWRRVRSSLLRFLRFSGKDPPDLSSVKHRRNLQLRLLPHVHPPTHLLVEPLARWLVRMREASEDHDCMFGASEFSTDFGSCCDLRHFHPVLPLDFLCFQLSFMCWDEICNHEFVICRYQ